MDDLRIMRIHVDLVLGGIVNQAPNSREGYVWWSCSIPVVVRDDFDVIIFPNANATGICTYLQR